MAPNNLTYNWNSYYQLIEQLALKIHQSNWQFDSLLCLARGGMPVGDVLSRLFHKPLAIWAVRSYREDAGQTQNELQLAGHITCADQRGFCGLHGRVLVVDDLVDSGQTLAQVVSQLQKQSAIDQIKTAVLWHKAGSSFTPDFVALHLVDTPWIVQPFEQYDQIDLDKLSQPG
jgi:hypoxanthine phosphoribosyltransferase